MYRLAIAIIGIVTHTTFRTVTTISADVKGMVRSKQGLIVSTLYVLSTCQFLQYRTLICCVLSELMTRYRVSVKEAIISVACFARRSKVA